MCTLGAYLDGVQPQLRGLPLLEGLEDERDGAEVGLVELLQHLLVLGGLWVLGLGGGWVVVWGGTRGGRRTISSGP